MGFQVHPRRRFKMATSGGKKVVAAAHRVLDRQAWGHRRGRFAVQRTLEHLKKGSVVLNENVKAVELNLPSTNQAANVGARRFLYENVPQMKFTNPHVMFTRTKDASKDADLQVVFVNGKKAAISTLEKTPSQLMEEVIKLTAAGGLENNDRETTLTEDNNR